MRTVPQTLQLTTLVGAVFVGLMVFSWGAYLWGDGDEGRVCFCSVVGAFAVPLFVGSIQARRGCPGGPRLLRIGSPLLLLAPDLFLAVWELADNLERHGYHLAAGGLSRPR